jgi:hypothetical protein
METKIAEDVSSTIAALEDERYAAILAGDAGSPIISSKTGSATCIPAAATASRQHKAARKLGHHAIQRARES